MTVLDASILIAFFDGRDEHHARALALLSSAADDDLVVNTLTLAEVFVSPARRGRLDAVLDALHDIDIREVPFPSDAGRRLARLRASTGVQMPDCCVLLAAEEHGARVASFDERLIGAAEQRRILVLPE